MSQNQAGSDYIIELEALDPGRYRSLEDRAAFGTARGRKNRVAIGLPRCVPEYQPGDGGLLEAADLVAFPAQAHAFYRLSTVLTLVPDQGCRFRSVEFTIDLEQLAGGKALPRIVRLKPQERTTNKVIKLETKEGVDLSAKVPVTEAFSVKLGDLRTRTEEITRTVVDLAGFGAGTQEAGWRFQLTESRDIPMSSPALEALIVAPGNEQCSAVLRVVAEIDILSRLDRWLTWMFASTHRSQLSHIFEFPPNVNLEGQL